jgi:hypothetical protein
MKKILLASALAIALTAGGCATVNKVVGAVTGATVDTNAVYVSANTYDAAAQIANAYLALPRCPKQAPACRDPQVTAKLAPLLRAAYASRAQLVAYSIAHPGVLGPQGLYDAVVSTGSALTQALAAYNIQVK